MRKLINRWTFAVLFLLSFCGLVVWNTLTQTDFHVSYNGFINGEFEGRGSFACVSINGSPYFPEMHLQDDKGMNWVVFELPIGSTTGKHSFSAQQRATGYHASSRGFAYMIGGAISKGQRHYYLHDMDLISGYLTIDKFSHEQFGLRVKGHFKAIFRDESNEEFIVQGEFNFESDGDSSYDCIKK